MKYQGFYLWRGGSSYRQISNEKSLAKFLYRQFSILTLDLARLDVLQQYRLLNDAELLIYVSGSAGLASVNCNQECHIIEISPSSVYLSDLYRHDSVVRGGRYTIYVCDYQSKAMSATGDPEWLDIKHDRFSQLLSSL